MLHFCTLADSYQHFCAVKCDSSVHWQLSINISEKLFFYSQDTR